MVDIISLPFQLLGRIASNLHTSSELEKELNDRFDGLSRSIETYQGKNITVKVSSISVQPRASIKGMKEPDLFWASNFPDPKPPDKIRAILFNDWITIVRFGIENGVIEDLRPSGVNFGFASTISSHSVAGNPDDQMPRMVIVPNSAEMYSEKLATKIVFDGHIGEFKEELLKCLDNLEYIQKNMENICFNLLMNLYRPSDEKWSDRTRAENLSDFLFDEGANLAIVEGVVRAFWKRSVDTESAGQTEEN